MGHEACGSGCGWMHMWIVNRGCGCWGPWLWVRDLGAGVFLETGARDGKTGTHLFETAQSVGRFGLDGRLRYNAGVEWLGTVEAGA